MTSIRTAEQLLDQEFLEIRARLLDIAAALDRIGRASGQVENDPRMARIREGLRVLEEPSQHRAEALQLAFSREYSAQWKAQLGLKG